MPRMFFWLLVHVSGTAGVYKQSNPASKIVLHRGCPILQQDVLAGFNFYLDLIAAVAFVLAPQIRQMILTFH